MISRLVFSGAKTSNNINTTELHQKAGCPHYWWQKSEATGEAKEGQNIGQVVLKFFFAFFVFFVLYFVFVFLYWREATGEN